MDNLNTANQLFRERNFAAAIEKYTKLTAKANNFYFYHENLALAKKAFGKYVESLKDFSTALTLNSDTVRSYYELRKYRPAQDGKQTPTLSIIVPVHNTEKYLAQCFSSILNQTYRDFELIVINDGSTDRSFKIIKDFMARDNRLVLINNDLPSGNPGSPRNQGIEIAKGQYIGFVDSDDWVETDYFATLVNAAKTHDADIVFAGGFRNCEGEDVDIRRYKKTPFNDKKSPLYKYHESFMIWDKIYNASLVKHLKIRLGETKAAVDVPFIFKAYYYLRNAAFCDNLVGYNYRRESENSVTVKYRKSSNCNFELEAYGEVNAWADINAIQKNYKNIIDFRKVNSYIYTLGIIDPQMFDAFFGKVKEQFHAIDRENIVRLTVMTKKGHVLGKFDAILQKNAGTLKGIFNCNSKPKVVQKPKASAQENNKKFPSSFYIDGPLKGILFFPDWSYSNPYQKLLYTSIADCFKIRVMGFKAEYFSKEVLETFIDEFDVIHLHWLHAFMEISTDSGADHLLDTLAYAKRLGYRVVYTAHNIISHDSAHFERELLFRRKAQAYYDYVLVHGTYARNRVIDEIGVPVNKIYIVPHGSYEGYYPNFVTRNTAREAFGISESEFVFLFFGAIKGYKGVDELLNAYATVRENHKNVRLIIAGRIFDATSEALIQAACTKDSSIICKLGFIAEQDVQKFFIACDIKILPYNRILTSGAVVLSFSFHTPVIAPNSGLIPEILRDGKQGFLYNTYQQMTRLMEQCALSFKDGEWSKISAGFDFLELNNSLRWSQIVSQAPFTELFPRFEPSRSRCPSGNPKTAAVKDDL